MDPPPYLLYSGPLQTGLHIDCHDGISLSVKSIDGSTPMATVKLKLSGRTVARLPVGTDGGSVRGFIGPHLYSFAIVNCSAPD